jgi:hypothetical protein
VVLVELSRSAFHVKREQHGICDTPAWTVGLQRGAGIDDTGDSLAQFFA